MLTPDSKRAVKCEREPNSIIKPEHGPNPKSDVEPKLGPKLPKNLIRSKNVCKSC